VVEVYLVLPVEYCVVLIGLIFRRFVWIWGGGGGGADIQLFPGLGVNVFISVCCVFCFFNRKENHYYTPLGICAAAQSRETAFA
jgi:hypothetical protein